MTERGYHRATLETTLLKRHVEVASWVPASAASAVITAHSLRRGRHKAALTACERVTLAAPRGTVPVLLGCHPNRENRQIGQCVMRFGRGPRLESGRPSQSSRLFESRNRFRPQQRPATIAFGDLSAHRGRTPAGEAFRNHWTCSVEGRRRSTPRGLSRCPGRSGATTG